jgi:septal ring factor EnvC (AmiA/AmiB activator)
MKTTKIHRKRMAATALVALLAIATPAFAWMGSWSGYGMGYGGGPATAGATLTAEQQKQVDAIQSKYQPQLDELQQKLNAKSSELATARANGDTTVAQLNALESELFQLERQYWTLLDQANTEVAQVAGTGFGSYFTCGYMGCNHQHYRGSVMPSGYMTCCW